MNVVSRPVAARLIKPSPLPAELDEALRKFCVDNKTGNVQINIKRGKVLGFRVEELFHLSDN